MITLDLHRRMPIYEQLCKKVTELVMTGGLQPGEQLPSVRLLARELGVNPNTVSKAYQELERQGILCSVAGKGSFVSSAQDVADTVKETYLKEYKKSCLQCHKAGITQNDLRAILEEIYTKEENGL